MTHVDFRAHVKIASRIVSYTFRPEEAANLRRYLRNRKICHWGFLSRYGYSTGRNVRRILVRGVNVPFPPEAKKLNISLRNGAF